MKNNKSRDFVFGGCVLILIGVATIYLEGVYLTISPIITLQKTPVVFWLVVFTELATGIYLLIHAKKIKK